MAEFTVSAKRPWVLAFKILMLLAAALLGSALTGMAQRTFQPVVVSVGANSVTIKTGRNEGGKLTDSDGGAVPVSNMAEYQVTANTVITVDDLPGQLPDVQPGMIAIVTVGSDRAVADSITAHTIPPPAEAAVKARQFGGLVKTEVVLALTDTRITVGVPGTEHARAYYIDSKTPVTSKGEAATVHVGDKVNVHSDGTRAQEIEIIGK